ncbi:hypothetical protein ACFL5O_12210, partial [Myxococcota bacterium]
MQNRDPDIPTDPEPNPQASLTKMPVEAENLSGTWVGPEHAAAVLPASAENRPSFRTGLADRKEASAEHTPKANRPPLRIADKIPTSLSDLPTADEMRTAIAPAPVENPADAQTDHAAQMATSLAKTDKRPKLKTHHRDKGTDRLADVRIDIPQERDSFGKESEPVAADGSQVAREEKTPDAQAAAARALVLSPKEPAGRADESRMSAREAGSHLYPKEGDHPDIGQTANEMDTAVDWASAATGSGRTANEAAKLRDPLAGGASGTRA